MPRVRQKYISPFGLIGRPEEATRVPERTKQEWVKRIGLKPRDLTAEICGDPLPGYSALDRAKTAGRLKCVRQ